MAQHEILVADTRTGAILDTVPFADFSLTATVDWGRHDTMTVRVPLTGADARRQQVTGIANEPWKRTFVLLADGVAVWAGPLMSTTFDHTSVSFACGGLTQIFAARMIFQKVTDSRSITTGPSDAIVYLLYFATDDGGAYSLPFDYVGTTGDTPLTTRTWEGRDLPTIYESVKKVVEEDGAPDTRIDVTLNANRTQLTWVARYGTPYLGRVAPIVAWDFPATIQELTGDLDGSGLLTRGYVLGDGQSADRLILDASNSLTDQGYPVLERADRSALSTRDLTTLKSLANSYSAANATQAQTWAVTVHPDYPGLNQWTLGDNAKFRTSGHWFLPDGEWLRRVTGFTLTDTTLALETAPPLT